MDLCNTGTCILRVIWGSTIHISKLHYEKLFSWEELTFEESHSTLIKEYFWTLLIIRERCTTLDMASDVFVPCIARMKDPRYLKARLPFLIVPSRPANTPGAVSFPSAKGTSSSSSRDHGEQRNDSIGHHTFLRRWEMDICRRRRAFSLRVHREIVCLIDDGR